METRPESNVALVVTNDELDVVNADALSLQLLGRPEEEILGQPLARLLGENIRLEVALRSTAMFRARFDEQIVELGGRRLRVNAIAVPLETGDGTGLVVTLEGDHRSSLR